MYYTYILRSLKQEGAIYVGSTEDLKLRLVQHNNRSNVSYSKRYSPWILETYLGVANLEDAKRFEKYLI